MKSFLSQRSVALLCFFLTVKAPPFIGVNAQGSCPMTLWVFSNVNDCEQIQPAESMGTIYADGQCHTLKKDRATNLTQPLFPGSYAAECTADGDLHFLHSGCLSNTCEVSSLVDGAVCDADYSSISTLFVTNPFDRPVQDPGTSFDGSYSCYFITGGTANDLSVAFAVFGDCSAAGCQVDGVAAPTAPTSRPVAPPTRLPIASTNVPISSPTNAPVPAPTSAPRVVPTAAPLATPAPFSEAPTADVENNMTLAPALLPSPSVSSSPPPNPLFRNSTTQGTASIPVNGTCTLPPPSSPSEIRETIVDLPDNGALQINRDGSITYIPNTNFVGFDSFQIQQCIINNDTNAAEKCEIITIDVEVTPAQSVISTLPPEESSSSSSGLYALAALAIIPLALLFYWIYRAKRTKNKGTAPSEALMGAVASAAPLGAEPPVNNVQWSATVQPYLPSTKDQVRDVVPSRAIGENPVVDVSVMTQSTTNHDGESYVPQPLALEDDSAMSRKNYHLHGSGQLHPLAAHLMEVRTTSASQHSTASSSVVAEPQARPIHSIYSSSGSTKRILRELDAASDTEPVLVNAILISDVDDDEQASDMPDPKEPANRLDI